MRLFQGDMAALEAGEPRQDLPCAVSPEKALLGFDLKFHSGYEVTIPMRELAGGESHLTILFRVRPDDNPQQFSYFQQRIAVPNIDEDAKGEAYLEGQFDLGEGKYHVDWLVRDRHERICSSSWDVEAALPVRDKDMELSIAARSALPSDGEPFGDDPPVVRTAETPLKVKVLVNFAPQNARSATLQPRDLSALISVLRTIHREPRIVKFSVVAFNLPERRIVHRQDQADRIDFRALGDAVKSISPGTVDLARLGQKNGETEFLTDLIRQETGTADAPDALIFAGPKALLEQNVPVETLKELGDLGYPVYYMNYNLSPQQVPWRDAIGHCVRQFKGTEFTISRPRDLWFSVTDMVTRIAKMKQEKRASVSPTE